MSDAQGSNIVAGQAAPIEKNYLVGGTYYYFGGIFGGLLILFGNEDSAISNTYIISLMDAAAFRCCARWAVTPLLPP